MKFLKNMSFGSINKALVGGVGAAFISDVTAFITDVLAWLTPAMPEDVQSGAASILAGVLALALIYFVPNVRSGGVVPAEAQGFIRGSGG